MKKALAGLIFLSIYATAHAQNVAIVNNKGITAKEFMWVFKKTHNSSSSATYEELSLYLNQYIDFKLKVLDARAQQMDRDTAYINEVKKYEEIVKERSRARLSKDVFNYIMDDYRDGVLVFNISEQRIWNVNSGNGTSISEEEQQKLEQQWVMDLRKKFPIRVDESMLRKLAKP